MIVVISAAALAMETPRTFLERIYASYATKNYSPFNHPEQVFAPALNAAIREDQRLSKGEVGYLDADPLCQCQDTGGMHSRIVSLARSNGSATARVIIEWRGTSDRREVRLKLSETPAGWRIADIATADEHSLLEDLEQSIRNARKH